MLSLGKEHFGSNAVKALIRSAMKRRQAWSAGSTRAATAASRWGTPDPATPIPAVTGSGVDALRVGAESHEQKESVIAQTRGGASSQRYHEDVSGQHGA